MKNHLNILSIILVISAIFFTSIAFDITPFLRGPGPYPPDWQWAYYFVNTLDKIWAPFIVILSMALFVVFLSKRNNIWIEKNEKKILFFLVMASIFFQASILFFGRAGIAVLLHRIINPELNGYFTASLFVDDLGDFLHVYSQNVLLLPMHAQGHPPGAILFFWFINKIALFFPSLGELMNNISPAHEDVRLLWLSLAPHQKLGAVISIIVIPFISSLIILPIYFLGKYVYDLRIGLRAALLYIFVPSVTLFLPINDVFISIFPIFSLLIFIKGLNKENKFYIFISGIIFFIGIFFSISMLPLAIVFLVLFILSFLNKRALISSNSLQLGASFLLGLALFPFLLFIFFEFNFIELVKVLMSGLPESRSYSIWLFYNLYDFFTFAGIPLLIIFAYMTKNLLTNISKNKLGKTDHLFLSFFVMLFLLDLSGAVRGEVGRIWLPFIPVFVLTVSNYATRVIKISQRGFLIILLLQAVQIIVMQEFWVPLW